MKNKANTKCPECGKTFYSVEGGFHKEDNEDFYSAICSKKCGKKQGLTNDEMNGID